MINNLFIYKPFSIKINKTNYLFFDLFIINNLLYVIQPYYKNFDPPFFITVNNIKIKINKIIKNIKYEPYKILVFNIPNELFDLKNYDLIIHYKKNKIFKNIHVIKENKKKTKLSLSTLCKNDLYLLPLFIEYYKKHGIENFYIYINKKINYNILQILNSIVYQFPEINLHFIEWNIEYFVNNKHHAQPSQIHHSIYFFGKPYNEYMLFCDLDEYFFLDNICLKQLIINNPLVDTFAFKNIWSKTLDRKIPKQFPSKFYCTKKFLPYSNRSKCIHKLKNIENINIHYHDNYLIENPIIDKKNFFFHFFHFSQPSRVINEDYFLMELPIT